MTKTIHCILNKWHRNHFTRYCTQWPKNANFSTYHTDTTIQYKM